MTLLSQLPGNFSAIQIPDTPQKSDNNQSKQQFSKWVFQKTNDDPNKIVATIHIPYRINSLRML